jgi:hypothetical protein
MESYTYYPMNARGSIGELVSLLHFIVVSSRIDAYGEFSLCCGKDE